MRALVAQRVFGLALGYEDLNDHKIPAPGYAAGGQPGQALGELEHAQSPLDHAPMPTRWPATKILIRGDSVFCRAAIMAWCEGERG